MFIARQPIFNRYLDVYGYELLFRSDFESKKFENVSSIHATATVLGGLFESGINQIIDDKIAFVNFDEKIINSEHSKLIDSKHMIIELVENIKITPDLIECIQLLKNEGYKIALDDFQESYKTYDLYDLADIIKFDILSTPLDSIRDEVRYALKSNKILLAEKIESQEEFIKAKEMGFHLFQGFFFSKPSIIGKSIENNSTKSQYTSILSELSKKEPCYQQLAEIIENDINIAYRIMRVISTRSGEDIVYSIKKALTYIGLKELERWVSILMIRDLGEAKPKELMTLSLIRKSFAEFIALKSNLKHLRLEASMMGLFSVIDAILDQNMKDALKDVSLTNWVKDALIDYKGDLGQINKLIFAYEKGDWEIVTQISDKINIDSEIIYEGYLASVKWAQDIIIDLRLI